MRCKNRIKVVPIDFGVAAANFENFRHEALPWPALQLGGVPRLVFVPPANF